MRTLKYILLATIFCVAACKKNDTPTPSSNNNPTDTTTAPDTTKPFISDTAMAVLVEELKQGDGWVMGMDINTARTTIYIYQEHISKKGFYLHAYNIATKSYSTVYEYSNPDWSNSNGTEGQRVHCANNKIYVVGGATNNRVVVLNDANGIISFWGDYDASNPTDVTTAGTNVYAYIAQGYILRFKMDSNAVPDTLGTSNAVGSFQSAIEYVPEGQGHLVIFTGLEPKRLELRNMLGQFEKSVPANVLGSPIAVDSKNRIYYIEANKIIRYAGDLSKKEEFPASGISDYSSRTNICIKEYSDHIQVFYKDHLRLYAMNISN